MSSGARGERGAVILMVTFSLIALFGFAALALDLSRMYIVKSQLQNAADAGALRAAKALDGTLAGLTTAEAKAREAVRHNRLFMVANPLADADITVEFASQPFPTSWSQAGGNCAGTRNNCYFARVTTSATGIASFFAGIIGVSTNAASAGAVAGRYRVAITPMAMCALDVTNCPSSTCTGISCTCGYTPGKAYTVSEVNTSGSEKIWLDPIATSHSTCMNGTNATRPYVCEGKTSPSLATAAKVYTTTGTRTTLLDELDSRFGDYSKSVCDPATAPPDSNIREYRFSEAAAVGWMSSPLTRQTSSVTEVTRDPWSGTADNDGVRWTFSRPQSSDASGFDESNYPAQRSGRSLTGTPYTQTAGNYFLGPTDAQGAEYKTAERRVLNLPMVQCPTPNGNCQELDVRMIGSFLMQTRAATANDMYLEFGGPITPWQLQAEIKLYNPYPDDR